MAVSSLEAARAWGRALRVDFAVKHGLTAGQAADLLEAAAELERREYHRSKGERLDGSERRELWQVRAALAGSTFEPSDGEGSEDLVWEFWSWLRANTPTPEGTSRTTRLRGDLAQAVAQDPDGVDRALAAWRWHGDLVGAGNESDAAGLADLLRSASSIEYLRPTGTSHDIAVVLSQLSGMPPELVDLHRDSRRAERAMATATRSAHNRRVAEGVEPAAHDDGDGRSRAPVLARSAHGTPYLELAPAELDALGAELETRAVVEAVDELRVGAAPRPQILLAQARIAWRGRLRAQRAMPTVGGRATDAAVEMDLPTARRVVLAELDAVYRATLFELDTLDAASVFPVEIYGRRLSNEFDHDHVLAAHNCLRSLAASAGVTAAGRISLQPRRFGQREITRHMALTAPLRWGGEDRGRQTRRGFAGAVAWLSLGAVQRCELADPETAAGSTARHIHSALRTFAAIATVDGLLAMVLRFRLTAAVLRSTETTTGRWFDQLSAALNEIDACVDIVLSDVPLASLLRAELLSDAMDGLADRLAAVPVDGAGHSLAGAVTRLRDAADLLRTVVARAT